MIGIPEEVRLEYAHDASLLTGIETGKVRLIPLTQGKYALVDDEDFEQLCKYKWYPQKGRFTWYPIRNTRTVNGKRTVMRMSREILGMAKGDGKIADHKNRNGLDNRRDN